MDIKKISVVGAGMMGRMIAFVFASKYSVGVYDVRHVDIKTGIREDARHVVSDAEIERRLAKISFTTQIDSTMISNADLVIEAIFEDMELKRKAFAWLEESCRPDCVFCTNTSVMSPSEISRDLRRRERFLATHFWNPAHLIPLVEVVKSDATSHETAQTVMDILTDIGKKPVLCKKDVPGFIANRLQHALWREAFYMVQEGIADAKTVDDACKYGPGLRWPVMGPMENSDMVGIELTRNIHEYVLKSLADNHEPSPLLQEMLGRGELGMKSGKGWQDWTPQQISASNNGLRKHLIKCNISNK